MINNRQETETRNPGLIKRLVTNPVSYIVAGGALFLGSATVGTKNFYELLNFKAPEKPAIVKRLDSAEETRAQVSSRLELLRQETPDYDSEKFQEVITPAYQVQREQMQALESGLNILEEEIKQMETYPEVKVHQANIGEYGHQIVKKTYSLLGSMVGIMISLFSAYSGVLFYKDRKRKAQQGATQ